MWYNYSTFALLIATLTESEVRFMTDLHARAAAAKEAALQVGAMLRNRGNMRIEQKAENDYVTEMDLKSEQMLRKALLGRFPEDGFYGEESGESECAKGRWIVDPIDGTQSFMRGHHEYTISIAYELQGELVIGCIYAPDLDEMFCAVRGEGAFLNDRPIHVSEIDRPREALAHCGYGHRVPEYFARTTPLLPSLLSHISDIRRYGSAAYALACVSCGRSELFFELGLHLYDIAAGLVILREAGGRATGWTEDERCEETGNIAASNGRLHDFLLASLRENK